MSPRELAKAAGLDSLTEASRIAGVPRRTLYAWHEERPRLFAVVLSGCAAIKKEAAQCSTGN